jgi:hypothetical protein
VPPSVLVSSANEVCLQCWVGWNRCLLPYHSLLSNAAAFLTSNNTEIILRTKRPCADRSTWVREAGGIGWPGFVLLAVGEG